MTFVAQPYERFVDDLLTSLTGGVIREEHLFTGPDDSYSLGAADAVGRSLRSLVPRRSSATAAGWRGKAGRSIAALHARRKGKGNGR